MSTQHLRADPFIVAGSLAANYTSTPVHIEYGDNVGIELSWTGTPTGAFTVELSISYDPASGNAGIWNEITLDPAISASGSADSALIELNQTTANWFRLVYTRTSGTGTLTGYAAYKPV